MKINQEGVTRIVFIFKKVVIKIPRVNYTWKHFLNGLLSNIRENECWKFNIGKYETGISHLLCPVLFCSWGGWVLIMQRADTDRHQEELNHEVMPNYKVHIDAGLGGDDKPDNYGYIENRLVKIDYGS